ncbi:MAG: glycerol-3-phosphate 1-O-acyltransferase [Gemmatimonadetes bacterium]|nr:MAG: glycerol-3-phosphate 1-O-acyltransferase [Gemmatimonadota bacterium]
MTYGLLLGLVIGTYLLGAIPFGFLIAKAHGVDIREKGSKNIGMTNVWRVLGWKAGVPVFVLDFAKGFVPVFLTRTLVPPEVLPVSMDLAVVFIGLAAVCGHIWTVFLHFKGGKGVATATGVFFALAPLATGIVMILFLLVVFPTRYISLGSISAAISLPVIIGVQVFVLRTAVPAVPTFYLALCIGLFVIFRHRSNIQRLLNGTENKFGTSSSSTSTKSA